MTRCMSTEMLVYSTHMASRARTTTSEVDDEVYFLTHGGTLSLLRLAFNRVWNLFDGEGIHVV